MGLPPKDEQTTEEQPTRLMSQDKWDGICERAANGESTQADTDTLLIECARLGRTALRWKQLALSWQEYAESQRSGIVEVSKQIEREVGR